MEQVCTTNTEVRPWQFNVLFCNQQLPTNTWSCYDDLADCAHPEIGREEKEPS